MNGVLRYRAGVLPLLAASAIWGAWNTADKYAVARLPVITVMAVMLAAAAGVLWTVLLVRGHRPPRPAQLGQLALTGLLEPALSHGIIGAGLVHVQATAASLLDGTEACFVVAIVAVFRRRPPSPRSVSGVLLAALGVAAIGGLHGGAGFGLGDALVLAGIASAALSSVLASRLLETLDPLVTTAYQFGFGFGFTLPLVAWEWAAGGPVSGPAAGPLAWVVASAACGGGLAAAFLLYNRAITRIPVTAAGVILNTIPLFGVAVAVIALGEAVSWWQVLGAALILGGIFLFADHDTGG